MELDLSAAALVNAGGSLLFLLEGIAILAIGRGSRRAVLVGGLGAFFGAAYIIENLVPPTSENAGFRVALYFPFIIPTIVFAGALAAHFAVGLPRRLQMATAMLGFLFSMAFAVLA